MEKNRQEPEVYENNGVLRVSPWVKLQHDAQARMNKFRSEHGLTANAAARIPAKEKSAEDPEDKDLLG